MDSNRLKRILESGADEDFALEGNLLSAAKGGAVGTIYVTSSRAGEGKTTTAIKIATALSKNVTGRVLLVDGNTLNPQLHSIYSLNANPGLAESLQGGTDLQSTIQATKVSNLDVMVSGSSDSGSGDINDSNTFAHKLAQLKQSYEYVIFDGTSVLSSSRACQIARHFDGVILTVECENTKWEVLDLAREKIDNVGGNVLGVILNKRRYYVPKALYGRI